MESVTVIIPTYRPEDYLAQCLDSLDLQTLAKDYFRVIIVLNGDRDPYWSMINNWCESKALRYELIYTQTKGVSNARNIALDKVSTPFVAFIDDDDYVSPDYLKSLFECIMIILKVLSHVVMCVHLMKKAISVQITFRVLITRPWHRVANRQCLVAEGFCHQVVAN